MHPLHVVWFKHDLRLRDHAPLKEALQHGQAVLLLYIWEPTLLADPHYSTRHWAFVRQSLDCLNEQLQSFGTSVCEVVGEVQEVFEKLHAAAPVQILYSYEESGLRITWQRDKAVKQFCQENQIPWRDFQHNGVQRGLSSRKTWVKDWHSYMESPQDQPYLSRLSTVSVSIELPFESVPELLKNLPADRKTTAFQPGGERAAHRYMESFFDQRSAQYSKSISKPEASRRGCSRLSPYLAWGNVSVRMVYQRFRVAMQAGIISKRNLNSFASRLVWHCHFIQKFESESRIEFENLNRGYDVQKKEFRADLFQAWAQGYTGFPLVDACMRCLHHTGYINFRMRAMVVSFLTHLLWQPWKEGAVYLASLFLDFEPGIHYAQFQMQTGVTGINTVRIYNPVKQSYEQDAEGIFIKKWVPELANCPLPFLHEPWKMTAMEQAMYGLHLDEVYPKPIVELENAHRLARTRIWAMRQEPLVKQEGARILKKHVVPSRKIIRINAN
ncbi:cryptochrome/deoxyribodipyrimidine photo-lyase family protein [Arundinibacter roseus]|uniref:Deoxyribodipyrimidine photo-lyase n=1 Tax=Arundinibacter roseus TaxID=2070510 RepID=A0A4R4K7J4_9BACT|nr:deoxyribodipyrimidine photo-lyase [Arundinibacter roseus]TDB63490.1 deoxyribodipyrimidine photo-lyase [Arundinibacter roseus]